MDRATGADRARPRRVDPRRDASHVCRVRGPRASPRAGLGDLGVGRGDRVGWLGANHPAFLETLFATAKLGAVLAPVNHRLDHTAIGDLLGEFSPTVVVVERSAVGVPLPRGVAARVVVGADTASDVDYEQLIARSGDEPIDEASRSIDLCMLPHTSGTTGRPKGVMLTHANVTWNVVNLLSVADFRNDDVTVAVTPFFRTGGTGVNVLPVLFKGGTVVVPEAGDPDEILALIERQHVTVGFGNPDLLDALTRSPRWDAADLSTIRVFITGGAPVPEHLIRTYAERNVPFLQGYGLSEAAPLVLVARSAERGAQGGLGRQATPAGRRPHHPTRRDNVRTERGRRAARQRAERDGRLLGPSRRDAEGARRGRVATHRGRRAASTTRDSSGSSTGSRTRSVRRVTSCTPATSSVPSSVTPRLSTWASRPSTGRAGRSSCSHPGVTSPRTTSSSSAARSSNRTKYRTRSRSWTGCHATPSASCSATSLSGSRGPTRRTGPPD